MDSCSPQSPGFSRWLLLGLLLAFTLVWFSNLEYRKLANPDEGRYAEISREMVLSGDWVTPRLNDLKYFEKPPLQYWATAMAFRVFGESQWAARWWPATTSFGCVLLMFWAGRRLFDEEIGLAAAAALGGCTGFVINAHINTLDAGLAAFLTVALLGFLLAQRPGATPAENRDWMLVVWAAMALGVLSKGLIGVVLPGAVLTIYLLIERDWRLLTRLHLGKGLLLLLLIAVPWFVAVSLANDEFARFFFIHEHFARFLTKVHRREGAWWYFVPILLFGAMPWLPFIAVRLRDGWRREGEPGTLQPRRLLLIWVAFIFLFFSVSGSKLPSYILPVFPALALFAAVEMRRMAPATLSRFAWGLAATGGGLLLVVLIGGERIARIFSKASSPFEIVRNIVPWIEASIFTFTAGAAVAAWSFRRHVRSVGIVALAFGSLGAGILAMDGHDELSRLSSSYDIVRGIEARQGPFDRTFPFYSVQMYDQTLPFYLKRPVTLVQYVDEFALGLDAEPGKGIRRVEDWKKRWVALEQGYAIISSSNYEQIAAEGLPMRVLGRDPRRVIVSRR
ncbi:MAG: glycosyltransferase family 39 protein [Gammaproteobacteria bacterium]|nr:glycosyltransferase family 39 protein [Candidatus Competibacteraceae bacterium]MCP5195206.1 glycosyltransferase family 39 protein [Gammaproteobacteria bacterium]